MNTAHMRQVSYLISLRVERRCDRLPQWRGSLETAAGQHFDFSTLAELNRLLCELGGWIDPPYPAKSHEEGQMNKFALLIAIVVGFASTLLITTPASPSATSAVSSQQSAWEQAIADQARREAERAQLDVPASAESLNAHIQDEPYPHGFEQSCSSRFVEWKHFIFVYRTDECNIP